MTREEYRSLNHRVMTDTLKRCTEPGPLLDAVMASAEKEYIVYQEGTVETSPQEKTVKPNPDMKVLVSTKRTFEAARDYKDSGKKICCLNFANNHHIGGAPWSAGAQEECLCRTSTLYPCLKAKEEDYYQRHTQQWIDHQIDEMGNDDLIYIPDVVVFKSDVSAPELLTEDQWFKTDIITSAAPVLDWQYDKNRYTSLMERRIKRILDVAEKEGVQVLILGAFGCGAFHNPPEIVSQLFNKMIRNYSFETVEFAVYCRGDDTNYQVFKDTIES